MYRKAARYIVKNPVYYSILLTQKEYWCITEYTVFTGINGIIICYTLETLLPTWNNCGVYLQNPQHAFCATAESAKLSQILFAKITNFRTHVLLKDWVVTEPLNRHFRIPHSKNTSFEEFPTLQLRNSTLRNRGIPHSTITEFHAPQSRNSTLRKCGIWWCRIPRFPQFSVYLFYFIYSYKLFTLCNYVL